MTTRHVHMLRRLGALSAALAALVLLGSGCLFDTRDANPPTEEGTQIIFDDPEDVFTGLRVALEGDAFSNYERATSDAFIFSPLLEDSLSPSFPPDIFDDWTRQVELDVARVIISEADTINVNFDLSTQINTNTFVRFRVTYSLRFVPRSDEKPTVYEGKADIDVRRLGGVWQMEYWDEVSRVGVNENTWGVLRGLYRGLVQ